MAPPTFVTSYQSVFNDSATPKTASVTLDTNDVLVVFGITEDAGTTIGTPTGGTGLTYTLQQSHVTASNTAVYAWTTVSGSNQTFTLSAAEGGSGTAWWGIQALRFSGSDGVGLSGKTQSTGAPAHSFTHQQANSAVAGAVGDWNAVDGTTRTWRTVNGITPTAGNSLERTYFRDSAHYGVYIGYWNDVGSITSNSYGLSAPTGQKYGIIVVEVKGTADAAATSSPLRRGYNVGALLQV